MADNENDKPKFVCVWRGVKPTREDLQQILADHQAWLEARAKGDPPHDLNGIDLKKSGLKRAILRRANLQEADLRRAKLQEANLIRANLKGACLRWANLKGANLTGANLQGTDLRMANLEIAIVTRVKYCRQTRCQGIRVETSYGSARFKRFAQDQDFIEELRGGPLRWRRWKTKDFWRSLRDLWWRKLLYWLWLIFADCGRTPWFWMGWAILFAIGFGFIFFYHLGPSSFRFDSGLPRTLGTMIYYSVVTFTTLGFGDITPDKPEAARWVMAEVILGYVMLGGLISILMTKLARRS